MTAFTHKLRMIRVDFFPGLVGAQDPLADTVMEKQVVENMEELNTCVIPGLECHFRPHHAEKIDNSEMCTFDEELAIRVFRGKQNQRSLGKGRPETE